MVWGRYSFGPATGNWAYFGNGIGIARTNDMNHPYFTQVGNVLLVLNDVPERFAEQVTPETTLNGIGRHFMTKEEITWEMRYPTLPIKKA